jgi:hypothetical protein
MPQSSLWARGYAGDYVDWWAPIVIGGGPYLERNVQATLCVIRRTKRDLSTISVCAIP